MFVEDIKSPGTNIAAEISKSKVSGFKEMCEFFSSDKCYEKIIDKYINIKMKSETELETTHRSEVNSTLWLKCVSSTTLNSDECATNVNNMNVKEKNLNKINIITDNLKSIKKPEILEISMIIKSKMDQLLLRTTEREEYEHAIISQLTINLSSSYNVKSIVRTGAVTYGFGGLETDLNLLAITGGNFYFNLTVE